MRKLSKKPVEVITNVHKTNKHFFKVLKGKSYFPYVMISISALLYVFAIQSIMQVAKTLPAGIGALASIPTLLIPSVDSYYSLFYLALNIPILLIFFRKIRRKFLYRTCYFLILSTLLNFVFFIPEVKDFFKTLIIKNPNHRPLADIISELVWPSLVLPFVAAIFIGLASAISWKYGGSTGGSDIIVYYISTKHKKDVGTTATIVSISILSVSFITLLILDSGLRKMWLPSLIGTFIYILIVNLVLNTVYPRYAKVLVEIHTVKLKMVEKWLDENYSHSYRFEWAFSGKHKKEKHFILTVMLLMEVKNFVNDIKAIDPKVWISVTRIETVFGNFNTKPVEEIN